MKINKAHRDGMESFARDWRSGDVMGNDRIKKERELAMAFNDRYGADFFHGYAWAKAKSACMEKSA